jgi:hypothetical protein
MKKNMIVRLALIAAAVSVSNSVFALVQEDASCQTSDGKYQVHIFFDEGVGPVRGANGVQPIYDATIEDENGNVVGNYATVDNGDQIKSVSFGRFEYLDKSSDGKKLDLGGPSTNFRNYFLSAKLDNGQTINDNNLNCQVFGGHLLNQ